MSNLSFTWSKNELEHNTQFELLYKKQLPFVLSAIFTIISHRQTAEDLSQDVMLSFWKNKKAGETYQNVQHYLLKAARFKCYDFLRIKYKSIEDYTVIEYHLPKSLSTSYVADQAIELSELKTRIKASISLLPERCRLVFVLNRSLGLSYQQIAEELKISVKTVEKHMSKALQLLRQDIFDRQ